MIMSYLDNLYRPPSCMMNTLQEKGIIGKTKQLIKDNRYGIGAGILAAGSAINPLTLPAAAYLGFRQFRHLKDPIYVDYNGNYKNYEKELMSKLGIMDRYIYKQRKNYQINQANRNIKNIIPFLSDSKINTISNKLYNMKEEIPLKYLGLEGFYDPVTNTITINKNSMNNKILRLFGKKIDYNQTLNHEKEHFEQAKLAKRIGGFSAMNKLNRSYQHYNDKFGYSKNPLEYYANVAAVGQDASKDRKKLVKTMLKYDKGIYFDDETLKDIANKNHKLRKQLNHVLF